MFVFSRAGRGGAFCEGAIEVERKLKEEVRFVKRKTQTTQDLFTQTSLPTVWGEIKTLKQSLAQNQYRDSVSFNTSNPSPTPDSPYYPSADGLQLKSKLQIQTADRTNTPNSTFVISSV
ncbi:Uncharacterized protein Rs2_39221 [Raphanus sativus]|nr:Uncharacterized protein Rs2_39221 [Raphanus sativus]